MLSALDHDASLGLSDDNAPSAIEINPTDILAQLKFMFGGLEKIAAYRNGRIEVGSTAGECRFFKLDEFDKIVAYVAERTSAREKTYLHAGLVKADGEKVELARQGLRGSHSKGCDVLCWPCIWGEADHANLEYDRSLKGTERDLHRMLAFDKAAEWGLVYATGSVPTLRMQGLIRLSEPAEPTDAMFWSVLKSITINGKLDAGANNSSQLIRLAGSYSFAGNGQKAVEVGEPLRIDEPVRVIRCDVKKQADLKSLHTYL